MAVSAAFAERAPFAVRQAKSSTLAQGRCVAECAASPRTRHSSPEPLPDAQPQDGIPSAAVIIRPYRCSGPMASPRETYKYVICNRENAGMGNAIFSQTTFPHFVLEIYIVPYLHVQHLSYRGDGSNFGGRPTVSSNRRLNHSSSSGLTLPSRRLRLKKRSAILTLPMH